MTTKSTTEAGTEAPANKEDDAWVLGPLLLIIFILCAATSWVHDKYVGWEKTEPVLYAYITPNETRVRTKNEWQPAIDWRKSGEQVLPFLKGTDNLLVAFDKTDGPDQWIMNGANNHEDDLPDNGWVERGSIKLVPKPYQAAIFEHNRVGEEGKGGVGRVIVKKLVNKYEPIVTQ